MAIESLRSFVTFAEYFALPEGSYRVSDQMHSIEHSVEAASRQRSWPSPR